MIVWRCKDESVLTQIFLISWEAKLFGIRCCLKNLQSNIRRLSWNRPKSTFVRWSNNLERHLALKLKLNGCRSWTQRWNAFNPFLYHPKDQFLYRPKDLWNWSLLFWDKKVKLTKVWAHKYSQKLIYDISSYVFNSLIYIIDCCFQGECRNIVTVKKIIGKILAKTWLQTFATKDIELIWKWSATANR